MNIGESKINAAGLRRKIIVIFLVSLFHFLLYGQEKPTKPTIRMEEFPLKVTIISRFFDFVKWPTHTGEDGNMGQFNIGLLGKSPLQEYKKVLQKSISIPGKQVIVKKIDQLEEIVECDVLIIAQSESKRLPEILSIIENKPILTIGDTEGYAERGVLINLYIVGNNVKFEINYKAVKQSRLVFMAKLYKLARVLKYSR
ncbi:MAG: YfiR family protein [bacterium]|nr:YfiR family protein [bacterium]